MKSSIILGIAAMGLFLGCEKQNSVKSGNGDKKDLADDTVVLKVDGKTLTQKDWDAYTNLRVAFYKLMKNPKKARQGPLGMDYDINRDLERVKKSTKESCMPLFIQNCAILGASEAYEKTHGPYTQEERKEVTEWLEKKYLTGGENKYRSMESLKAKIKKPENLAEFDRQFKDEVETELFLRVACSNRYVIDEMVITNVYVRHAVNNYVANETNKFIQAQAQEVLKRIKAGEDFCDLADKYSMNPEKQTGGCLGKLSASDFPGEEEVWNAVKNLEEGQTTGIIDADDSWQILKVMKRDDSNPEGPELELAQIYFRRAWVIPELSRADVIKALEDDRRQRLVRETLEERLPKMKIEFPLGREIFGNLDNVKPMMDMIDGKITNFNQNVTGVMQ